MIISQYFHVIDFLIVLIEPYYCIPRPKIKPHLIKTTSLLCGLATCVISFLVIRYVSARTLERIKLVGTLCWKRHLFALSSRLQDEPGISTGVDIKMVEMAKLACGQVIIDNSGYLRFFSKQNYHPQKNTSRESSFGEDPG